MEVITQPTGPVAANCYILSDNQKGLIVDPGDNGKMIQDIVDSLHLQVQGILLTHAHFDHCGAIDHLAQVYHCPVYINPAEEEFLTDPQKNASSYFGVGDLILKTKPMVFHPGKQSIGDFEVEAYFAPGHSAGSTILKIGNNLFTGDVLFQGSIGRTDLPTGDPALMKQSLKLIHTFDQDAVVYPGHGPSTTIGQELKTNPYLLYEMF